MWTGVTDFNGHLGVTRFGDFPYDTALTYSQDWGIFEWHPDPGVAATDSALYTSTVSSLNSYYANGAHALFPGWWENTNGTTFLLTDSNFAVGLHDWLNAQPDLPPPGGQGLEAQYFNNTNLSGTPVLTRVDPTVNFTWTGISPGTGVNTTNFSTVWTGWVQPRYTETYTFYTDTDDGARLYVNNTTMVDHFVTQGATEYSGTIDLVAGRYYPITMQYFQGTGAGVATLSWSSASQTMMKYALGLNPSVPSVTGLPVTTPVGGHLSMPFQRNTAATDIVLSVEAGSDLSTWTTLATLPAGATSWTTSGATVTDSNGAVTVTDSTAISSVTKRFLRLRVTLPT